VSKLKGMIKGQELPMICHKCKHEFEAEIVVGVAIEVFTAHLKTIYCPKCHSNWKKLAFLDRAPNAFTEMQDADPKAAAS